MIKNFKKIIVILACFVAVSVNAAPADTIIITEVQYNPAGSEAEAEWFELFNPTDSEVSLDGWTIEEDAGPFYTFQSISIESGEYLLIVNDTASFNGDFPTITPDVDMAGMGCFNDTECLRLNNTGTDNLTLRDGDVASGSIIDFVSWGDAGFASSGNGESICRDSSEDTDTAADWVDDCIPSPKSGDYEFNEPVSGNNSSRKRGGSIRFICGDPSADNYNNTRFGRHRSSRCKYSEKENSVSDVVKPKCNLSYTTQLGYGSSGVSVKLLQSCLNQRGFNAGIEDGIFGSQTEASVFRFQSSYDLLPNSGIADIITLVFLGFK
ncbi:MAG: lamin tail domain-containing protein [Candidatus Pacebacteria bacterium]|nr:lamin tail domain-containing protein [Candidatus Paceibacterota bacterium]